MYGLSTRDTFVTVYKRQVRKSLLRANLAVLTIEGLRIWENLMPAEKKRFKKRLDAINAQPRKARLLLRHAIETYFVTDKELESDAHQYVTEVADLVRHDPEHPLFFLDANISERTGYPEEITIVKFSVSNGVEEIFHAQFSCKGVTKQELERTMRAMPAELHLIPLRTISEDSRNLEDVYDAIRRFSSCQPLFAASVKIKACLTAMLIINLADTTAEIPPFEVLQAEMLADNLLGSPSEQSREKPKSFSFFERDSSKFLACDFHKECEMSSLCTMFCSLKTAYTCGELIAPVLGVQCEEGRHIIKEGFRPPCTVLEAAEDSLQTFQS